MKSKWMLSVLALLLPGSLPAQTLAGSVSTSSGSRIAARITVLYSSDGAAIHTYDRGEDGIFSISLDAGPVAASATAAGCASHEIDLSNGVPSTARFTLHRMALVQAGYETHAAEGSLVLRSGCAIWNRAAYGSMTGSSP